MEPVYELKKKYTSPKTKGTYRSGSNDQGKSAPVVRQRVMVLDALTGKRHFDG